MVAAPPLHSTGLAKPPQSGERQQVRKKTPLRNDNSNLQQPTKRPPPPPFYPSLCPLPPAPTLCKQNKQTSESSSVQRTGSTSLTKLASSIPLPDFLDPFLGLLSPYISGLDSLLTGLQLSISPDSTPKPLSDLLPHLLVGLGVVSTLLVFMRRFFGRRSSSQDGTPLISGEVSPDPNRSEDFVSVKHGAEEFTLKYPVNTITSGALTVGALRNDCSKLTSVEPARISLICGGKSLKDDAATLASFGISNAAKILCMGSTAPIPSDPGAESPLKPKKKKKKSGAKLKASATPEPEAKKILSPMEKIDAVWDGIVANLMPLAEEFMNNPPADQGKRVDAHRRLSETMMGELLKLDSVESSEPEVRARRKGVVKDIQNTLEGLDRVLKDQGSLKDFGLD